MTGAKQYPCAHCDETFSNPVVLGGHVHARHPEHRRARGGLSSTALTFLQREQPRRHSGRSLRRDTDTWPGRP